MAPFLPEVHGFCEPRFAPVRDAFLQHFRDGLECGASVAVWLDGGWVVDLWAGWQDAKRQKPWQRDTLVNVLSATKGLAAACMMQQVERGLLDLDAPVSEYWPEFSQGGKSAARVRHFLTHESGAIGIRAPLSVEEMYDHDHMAALLAREEAFWEPGTESNYHVRSYGWLNEELLRRVTGNRGDTLIRQDIVEPLEIDFLLGFGGECDAQVAELSTGAGMAPAVRARLMQDELVRAALLNPTLPPDEFNSRRWRSTPLLASNGHCNARALARFYACLASDGELDGVRLLRPETVRLATSEHSYGPDRVFFQPVRRGLGFVLSREIDGHFGHMGYGGAYGGGDLHHGMGFGYSMNLLGPAIADKRAETLCRAAYECLSGRKSGRPTAA